MIDQSSISSIASRYGLPPTLLSSVLQIGQGVPEHLASTYGMEVKDVQGNEMLQAELAARGLQASFQQYGSWDKALAQYYTGNPDTGPGAPGASQVQSTLGLAAVTPNMGMDKYSGQLNSSMFDSLATAWKPFAQSGGIINDSQIQAFTHQATQISQGGRPPGPGHHTGGQPNPGDISMTRSDPNLVGGRSYGAGQCTALAANMLGWIPEYAGNANNWVNTVPQKVPGAKVSTKAAPGSAVIWQGGQYGADGRFGHVGVVVAVNDDGSIQIANQNWPEGHGPNIRTLPASEAGGLSYILPPPDQAALSQAQAKMGGDQIRMGGKVDTSQAKAAVGPQPVAPKTGGAEQPQAQQKAHGPQDVAAFKQQAHAAGIHDPSIFHGKNLPYISSLSKQLLGRAPTLDELAETAGMTDQQVRQWVMAQPHPTYPHATAGDIKQWTDKASLASVHRTGRAPYLSEATRFMAANASLSDINAFYEHPSMTTPVGQQQKEAAQFDNVLEMRTGGTKKQ